MDDYTTTADIKQPTFAELTHDEQEQVIAYLRSRLGEKFNEDILRKQQNKLST